MANEEQLSILKQGANVWNKWRKDNPDVKIDLSEVKLSEGNFTEANLREASFWKATLHGVSFRRANLRGASFDYVRLSRIIFVEADLRGASLDQANLTWSYIHKAKLMEARVGATVFSNVDLSLTLGLDTVKHRGPTTIGTDTLVMSKGKIPEAFLRGCGLSDWEIEQAKLYNPELSNDEITQIQYKVYELRATQALQISPLFISYSHSNSKFVDKVGDNLTKKGIRYWRDIHYLKAGRMEKQIDRAIRQNPTVLLVLSEHSLDSDWVEHEVRTARQLEKDMGRDVLCPVALDDSWKNSKWEKRIMEQIMKYNILDFSAWEDDVKFEGIFRKLIDGLELFYKG